MSEHAGEIAELRQDIRTERERLDAIKKELFDRMLAKKPLSAASTSSCSWNMTANQS